MDAQKTSNRGIELSLLSTCPVLCNYCPQESLQNAHTRDNIKRRLMTGDDVLSVVRNATRGTDGDVPVRVHLSAFTEPCMSPHLPTILDLIDASPLVSEVRMFSTGVGLDQPVIDALHRSSKLTLIDWHLQPREADMNGGLWEYSEAGRLDGLPSKGTIVSYVNERTPEEESIRLQFPFAIERRQVVSRANNVVQLQRRPVKHPVKCSKLTSRPQPVVIPTGDTFACCNDFGLTLKLGNLLTDDWMSLDFERIIAMQHEPSCGAICFNRCHFAKRR